MAIENMENQRSKAAENNRCRYHRVKVDWQQSASFGGWVRKICPNVAKYLAGGWKTFRPATVVEHRAGLTNAKGSSHG